MVLWKRSCLCLHKSGQCLWMRAACFSACLCKCVSVLTSKNKHLPALFGQTVYTIWGTYRSFLSLCLDLIICNVISALVAKCLQCNTAFSQVLFCVWRLSACFLCSLEKTITQITLYLQDWQQYAWRAAASETLWHHIFDQPSLSQRDRPYLHPEAHWGYETLWSVWGGKWT